MLRERQYFENMRVFWFSDGPGLSPICPHCWDFDVTMGVCRTGGLGCQKLICEEDKKSPEQASFSSSGKGDGPACSVGGNALGTEGGGAGHRIGPDLFFLCHHV